MNEQSKDNTGFEAQISIGRNLWVHLDRYLQGDGWDGSEPKRHANLHEALTAVVCALNLPNRQTSFASYRVLRHWSPTVGDAPDVVAFISGNAACITSYRSDYTPMVYTHDVNGGFEAFNLKSHQDFSTNRGARRVP